ncbi:MAG: tetratricopeptide repeat protein, partial [Spirochaetota bacterium]
EPESDPEPEPEPDPEPGPVDTESREVEARHNVTVGDEVELNLPGTGWIYLGEENDAEGLSFRRRRTSSGNTVFLFSADEAGEYVARFQRQDLDTGAFDQQRVAVEAAPEPSAGGGNDAAPPGAVDDAAAGDAGAGGDAGAEIGRSNPTVEDLADPEAESDGDFAPDVTGEEQGQGEQEDDGEDDQGDVDEAAEEEPVDVDEAYALLEAGDREAALETFLDGDPGDDPEVHDTIAELAYELEEYGTARRHWQRNLDGEDSSYRRAARDGLFRTALATEDTEGAWEHYSALTDAGDEPEAEQALELGLLLLESSEAARAIEPLEQYLAEEGDDSPQPTQSATDTESGTPEADRAEIYFRLAELYESEREARSALEYYERVVDEYPLSKYWEPAEARVQYLRRHFFDIR